MEIGVGGITILPETEQDIAYITDTLGLKDDGDKITVKKVQSQFCCDEDMRLEIRR